MVTHDADVASHAHRIIDMRDGAIVGERTIRESLVPGPAVPA